MLDGVLAEAVFCACAPSGKRAATAIIESTTGPFMFPAERLRRIDANANFECFSIAGSHF
jgi:hypothetical protein